MLRNFLFLLFKLLTILLFYSVNYTKAWWSKNKALPNREEIWDVLQLSEAELEKPENALEKELFIWYYDVYLPAVGILERGHPVLQASHRYHRYCGYAESFGDRYQ